MLLNIKDMRQITHNCLEVYMYEGTFGFKRFTDKQMELFRDNEVFYSRSRCAAGICLDFYTDSDYIKFAYSLGLKSSRDCYSFDIYINDSLKEVIQDNYYEKQSSVIICPLKTDGVKHVTIYLPYTAEVFLYDFEISDTAEISPVSEIKKKLLCMGDSITQGFDAKINTKGYALQLARHFNMELLNQGIGGYYFNEALLDTNLPYKPDVMTIAYGTNDWSKFKSKEEFYSGAEGFVSKASALYKDIPIYVISPMWRKGIDAIKPMGSFCSIGEILADICSKYPNVNMINGLKLVPHNPELLTDNVHPNEQALSFYAQNLIKEMSF